MYENRRYLIFPTSELDKIDFSQVLETSKDTTRKTVDETLAFVKWVGDMPSSVATLTNTQGPYTHSEILIILATSPWDPEEIETV